MNSENLETASPGSANRSPRNEENEVESAPAAHASEEARGENSESTLLPPPDAEPANPGDPEEHAENRTTYKNYCESTGFSFFFFSWMTKWIKRASTGNLKHEEFPDIPDADIDQASAIEFGVCLEDYRDYEKCNKLVRFVGRARLCVLRVFRRDFLFLFFFSVVNDMFEVFNIFLLKHVMKQKMPGDRRELVRCKRLSPADMCLVCLVLTVNLIDIVTDGHHYFYYRRLVLKIENLLFSFLFSRIISKNHYELTDEGGRDSFAKRMESDASLNITMLPRYRQSSNLLESSANLNLDTTAKKTQHGDGDETEPRTYEEDVSLLNLALFDISEISWGILKLVDLCTIPLKIMIVGLWLYYQVGVTAIKAVVFIIIASTIMILSECQSAKLVKGYVTRIDDRVSKTLVILENMTNFKIFRWIEHCRNSVMMSRIVELQLCVKRTLLNAIGSWLGISLPNILALAVFLIYSTNNKNGVTLDPSFSIPLIHTLHHFIKPFRELPTDLSDHLETNISCYRIESFLFSKQLLSNIYAGLTRKKKQGAGQEGKADSKGTDSSPYDEEAETERSTLGDEADTKEAEGAPAPPAPAAEPAATYMPTERVATERAATERAETEQAATADEPTVRKRERETERGGHYVVYMKNATFKRGERTALSRISFAIEPGDKVVISGSNIYEKMLLTMALIDELQHTQGRQPTRAGVYQNYYLNQKRRIGIVSQTPWIPMGTVRSIIVFGQEFNRKLYNKVVDVCRLRHDFGNWKLGDLRYVDEGGQNLSTGQKVRISLARTLYTVYVNHDALGWKRGRPAHAHAGEMGNLIILDEIFTVLDPIIGLNIFENLFGPEGVLNKFTCVLNVQDSFLQFLRGFEFDKSFKFYNMAATFIHQFDVNSYMAEAGDAAAKEALLKSYTKDVVDEVRAEPAEAAGTAPDHKAGEAAGETMRKSELFQAGKEKDFSLVKWENFVWYLKKVNLKLVTCVVGASLGAMMTNVGSDIVISKWTSIPAKAPEVVKGRRS